MAKTRQGTSDLLKARAYCARQERSTKEVRDKLLRGGASRGEAEAIIGQLAKEGFLNEARFAEHYAVSKSRQKGWGPRKIEQGLRLKGVPDALIAQGLRAMDGGEEEGRLCSAVAKRWAREREEDPMLRRAKVVRYFVGKGFAAERVEAALDGLG